MTDTDSILQKLEAFRAEQREANQNILSQLIRRRRIAEAWQALPKRIHRIEKHLALPPVK